MNYIKGKELNSDELSNLRIGDKIVLDFLKATEICGHWLGGSHNAKIVKKLNGSGSKEVMIELENTTDKNDKIFPKIYEIGLLMEFSYVKCYMESNNYLTNGQISPQPDLSSLTNEQLINELNRRLLKEN